MSQQMYNVERILKKRRIKKQVFFFIFQNFH